MITFKTISSFRQRLSSLLKIKRGVYGSVKSDISNEFINKDIDSIRQNRDMILMEGDVILIKLRLPDKKQRLSKRDGYRLIYLVSKTSEIIVFLDIYPKNGPKQQLDIGLSDLKRLLGEFVEESEAGLLENFEFN